MLRFIESLHYQTGERMNGMHQQTAQYVVGIEGGGTKTAAVIADREGHVVGQYTGPGSNPNSTPPAELEHVLREVWRGLYRQAPQQIRQRVVHVFAGMSGGGQAEHRLLFSRLLPKLIYDVQIDKNHSCPVPSAPQVPPVTVDHDAVTALYSGTLGRSGVVSIAGTGSIAFGIGTNGKRARVGGWGYLLGDPGSGYAIGREALQAVFAAHDQCGPPTVLTERVCAHFQVQQPPDIIAVVYAPGEARRTIAPLSRLVVQAAEEGDTVAMRILEKAQQEAVRIIHCLLNRLFDVRRHGSAGGQREICRQDSAGVQGEIPEAIPVVLAGGVYNNESWFKPYIARELERSGWSVEIVTPAVPPVAGAVIAAWQQKGVQVGKQFLEKWDRSETKF
jgi:N-acetylglucosamine kinase-like BadF-type ATPase